jgi:hypothetical protein
MPKNEINVSYGNCMCNLIRNCKNAFLEWLCHSTQPSTKYDSIPQIFVSNHIIIWELHNFFILGTLVGKYWHLFLYKSHIFIWILNIFSSLFIYSYVHILFGPFLPPSPHPHLFPHPFASMQNLFCPSLQFCWREDITNNKKDKAFLLVEIRIAIQGDS